MCHGEKSPAFPDPSPSSLYRDDIQAMVFGSPDAAHKVAILPDIFGCNPFYQGFATHLAARGARVYLIDIFAGLGDLPKATREAAFERRHKLKDRVFVDAFEQFLANEKLAGVIGFCLGGLYVFELARRNVAGALVAFYPFPQGLVNQDALDVPFDYLPSVATPHTVLIGDADASVSPEHIARLRDIAADNPALDLNVFETSGHGFLADLAADDELKRSNAERALARCEAVLGLA
ncbi:MAG: carboxymethylenebutenolidase 2 [Proteobacteria bacterium]|nr:MAG: carboxymethylenebutenolidase 2 [Pseudomonadota bacterium]